MPRSGLVQLNMHDLEHRLPDVSAWQLGEKKLTLKQLDNFAKAIHTFGFLAQQFKVGAIVVGRRAMDLRLVDRESFFTFYRVYIGEERRKTTNSENDGDFYNNQNLRVGRAFTTNVIRTALEGRLSFSEAYDLTGLRDGTFHNYASHLGFDL